MKQFEVIHDPKSTESTQCALIEFESLSAAKTARLLSGGYIVDRVISVEPLWKEINLDEMEKTQGTASATTGPSRGTELKQEEKAKTNIVAEILAAGYILSDQVVNKAKEWDGKYGVSEKLKHYVDEIGEKTKEYIEIYGVQEPLDRAKQATQSGFEHTKESLGNIAEKAGETGVGKRTQETYEGLVQKGADYHKEALEIKERKEHVAKAD